jgi:hypothetical protein
MKTLLAFVLMGTPLLLGTLAWGQEKPLKEGYCKCANGTSMCNLKGSIVSMPQTCTLVNLVEPQFVPAVKKPFTEDDWLALWAANENRARELQLAVVDKCYPNARPDGLSPDDACFNKGIADLWKQLRSTKPWSCADPHRVLLHSEDGTIHVCMKITEK